jgi:hypothetical protein
MLISFPEVDERKMTAFHEAFIRFRHAGWREIPRQGDPMKKPAILMIAAAALAAAVLAGCGSSGGGTTTTTTTTAPSASTLAPIHGPYSPKIDPANFVDTIDNPYFPLEPGTGFH